MGPARIDQRWLAVARRISSPPCDPVSFVSMSSSVRRLLNDILDPSADRLCAFSELAERVRGAVGAAPEDWTADPPAGAGTR